MNAPGDKALNGNNQQVIANGGLLISGAGGADDAEYSLEVAEDIKVVGNAVLGSVNVAEGEVVMTTGGAVSIAETLSVGESASGRFAVTNIGEVSTNADLSAEGSVTICDSEDGSKVFTVGSAINAASQVSHGSRAHRWKSVESDVAAVDASEVYSKVKLDGATSYYLPQATASNDGLYMKFHNVNASACTLYPQSGQQLDGEDDIELAQHEVIAFECMDGAWVISM